MMCYTHTDGVSASQSMIRREHTTSVDSFELYRAHAQCMSTHLDDFRVVDDAVTDGSDDLRLQQSVLLCHLIGILYDSITLRSGLNFWQLSKREFVRLASHPLLSPEFTELSRLHEEQ